jgi:DNA-directed RNA polymerase subunit RPC12/RpoP
MIGSLELTIYKSMKYLLICSYCGHKVYNEGKDFSSLTEVPFAPIPARWDGKDKTTIKQPRKFKCSECGRLLKTVDLTPKEEDKDKPDNFDFPYAK